VWYEDGATIAGLTGTEDERSPRYSISSCSIALLAVTALAGYNLAVGPDSFLPGLLAVGPCLAAISAGPIGVALVGGYATLLSLGLALWSEGHLDGERLWFNIAAIALVTVSSVVLATRRWRLERRAKETEMHRRFFAEIVASSADAITGITLDGTITAWNKGAERLYGYAGAEAVGQNMAMIIPANEEDELTDLLAKLARGEQISHYDTRRVRKDGVVLDVSVTISPIRDATGTVVGASAVARDITARIKAEEHRRSMEELSHRSQRLQSLGQLAGGVAHDFNNLLTVIANYTAFVAEATADDEALQADLSKIKSAVDRAAALVQQLLIFARGETVESEVFDVNLVVSDVRSLLSRTIGENIKLISLPSPETLSVYSDRGQIEQVLMNLAINARDAMPDGGTLVIETGLTELDGTQPDMQPPARPGHYVRLVVSDTGTGMTPDVMAHVFEPFFSTKPRDKGTGLGLATVYGIVADAGGSINVYSESGIGTTMRVYLPAVDQPSLQMATPPEVQAPRGNGETILVVEDEDAIRQLVVRILDRHGYRVLSADRAQRALIIDTEHHSDMLLTDVIMPEMSGHQLAEVMSRRHPGMPVLYMSGYSDGLLGPQSSVDDGIELIRKPFAADDLLYRIHDMLSPDGFAFTRQPHSRAAMS
jgi:PAS domain S-box-containing protein